MSKKVKIFHIIYPAAMLVALIVLAVFDKSVRDIPGAISRLNPFWALGALSLMAAFYALDAVTLQKPIKWFAGARLSFLKSAKIAAVGQFYSAITPSSSGGQPFQAMYLKDCGVPVGGSAPVLVLKFLLWQIAVTAVSLIALVTSSGRAVFAMPGMKILIIIGLGAHILSVAGCVLMLVSPRAAEVLGAKILSLLHSVRLVRRLEYQKARFASLIAEYSLATKLIRSDFRRTGLMLLCSLLQYFCYLFITYFIYRSFSLDVYPFIHILIVQSILFVSLSFLPIPGLAVASEGAFFLVFYAVFPGAFAYIATILWRLITYYLHLIVGSIVIITDSAKKVSKSA